MVVASLGDAERLVEAVLTTSPDLDLPDSEDGHRRVLAVLTHLSAARDGRVARDSAL